MICLQCQLQQKLSAQKVLTVVDLDISDCVARRDCVTNLRGVVVAAHKKILALDLLTVVAKAVTTCGELCIL